MDYWSIIINNIINSIFDLYTFYILYSLFIIFIFYIFIIYLQNVGLQFLDDMPELIVSPEVLKGIVVTFQFMHQSVISASALYLQVCTITLNNIII